MCKWENESFRNSYEPLFGLVGTLLDSYLVKSRIYVCECVVCRSRKRKSICRRHHNKQKKLKHTATNRNRQQQQQQNIRDSFHQMKNSEALASRGDCWRFSMKWTIIILSLCVICATRVWSANSMASELNDDEDEFGVRKVCLNGPRMNGAKHTVFSFISFFYIKFQK